METQTGTKDCYYYFFVEPLQSRYQDDGKSRPLVEVPVSTEKRTVTMAMLGKPNQIELIRFHLPGCAGERLTDDDCKLLQTLKEHALSMLRIGYDVDTQLSPLTTWLFKVPGAPLGFGFNTREHLNPNWVVNGENIKNLYINSFGVRDQMRLLTDAMDRRVPLQFQFLSLYKLLEHEFRVAGEWDPSFEGHLEQFDPIYQEMKISTRSLSSYIHSLRDRCAHIRGRGKFVGVTALSNKDALELGKAMPLMTSICVAALNNRHADKGFRIEHQPSRQVGPDSQDLAQ